MSDTLILFLFDFKDTLTYFAKTNPILTFLIIMIALIFFFLTPIPINSFVYFICGFLYGPLLGALFIVIANVIASYLAYFIYNWLSINPLEHYSKLKDIQKHLKEENNVFFYFINWRLILVLPYFVINFMAPLFHISKKKVLIASALGSFPSAFVYAYFGNEIIQSQSLVQIFTLQNIMLVFAYIAIINSFFFIKKFKRRFLLKNI